MQCKFKKIAGNLSRNNTIMDLKQVKGTRIVVVVKKEKCLHLLHTGSFIHLDHDPRKTVETIIQSFIFKIERFIN